MISDRKAFASGALFLAFGAATLAVSLGYPTGSARQMGPGYFPVLLSIVLIALSIPIIARSLSGPSQPFPSLALKPLLLVPAACMAFMFLLKPAGLIVAVIVAMLISACASSNRSWPITVLVSTLLALASGFVFVSLLGQPLPLLGYWFGG